MTANRHERRDGPDPGLDWLERLATRVTIGVFVALVALGLLVVLLR